MTGSLKDVFPKTTERSAEVSPHAESAGSGIAKAPTADRREKLHQTASAAARTIGAGVSEAGRRALPVVRSAIERVGRLTAGQWLALVLEAIFVPIMLLFYGTAISTGMQICFPDLATPLSNIFLFEDWADDEALSRLTRADAVTVFVVFVTSVYWWLFMKLLIGERVVTPTRFQKLLRVLAPAILVMDAVFLFIGLQEGSAWDDDATSTLKTLAGTLLYVLLLAGFSSITVALSQKKEK